MQVVLWLLAPGHEDSSRAADFSFQPNGSYGLRSEDMDQSSAPLGSAITKGRTDPAVRARTVMVLR